MADRLGQRVGNYQLIRLLGRGGFAEVYLGQHLYLNNRVAAIKILSTALGDKEVQQFLQEAQTLSQLSHPHIVNLLDFSVEQNVPFLIMEYLPGGTLRQQVPAETLVPLNQVVLYVSQIAEALQYAHEKRIMHRDIKPENMLLRGPQDVVLTDFGIAAIAHSTQSMGARETVGTALYMAPEQIQGYPRPATDQYALGVIVYEWLTGVRPFRGNALQLYYQHLNIPAEPLRRYNSALSAEVESIVMRTLEKDWQRRFPDIQTFARTLEQAAGPSHPLILPAPATPIPPPPPALWVPPQPYENKPQPSGQMNPVAQHPVRLAGADSREVRIETVTPAGATGFTPPQALLTPAESGLAHRERRASFSLASGLSRWKPTRATTLLLIAVACIVVFGSTLLAATGVFSRPGVGSGTTPTATAPLKAKSSPTQSASPIPLAAAPDKQIFRYPLSFGDLATFDPALAQDTASDFAIKAVFTGLEGLNDTGQVIDQLASSHQVSSDGLTYTFTLNQNAKFSDGTQLTAADVAFSVDRTMLPATQSPVTFYMNLLKDYDKITAGKINTLIGDSIIVVDPLTIKFIISKPAAYFLATMTSDSWYVVEKSLVNKYANRWTDHLAEGGGAGPYKVQQWDHNKGIDLVPNPNWYGPAPRIQHIAYYQEASDQIAYQAYQNGQLDYAIVPTAEVPNARAKGDFHENTSQVTTYLMMNYLTKPFDNIKIRQAFALAINRDVLNSTVMNGTVSPSWHFIPPGTPGYNANLTGPAGVTSTAGDTAKARQLLQEGLQAAGYTSVGALPPIKLTYYSPSATVNSYVNAIVNMWETTLGVSVSLTTLDFPKLLDSITAAQNNANGIQMWRGGWLADYTDPQDWLSIFFQPKGDENDENYGQNSSTSAVQQQQVQRLLAAADVDNDSAHRLQTYESAEQQIINDVGVIPLWHPNNDVVIKSNVYGFVLNSLQIIPPNDWSNIFITQ